MSAGRVVGWIGAAWIVLAAGNLVRLGVEDRLIGHPARQMVPLLSGGPEIRVPIVCGWPALLGLHQELTVGLQPEGWDEEYWQHHRAGPQDLWYMNVGRVQLRSRMEDPVGHTVPDLQDRTATASADGSSYRDNVIVGADFAFYPDVPRGDSVLHVSAVTIPPGLLRAHPNLALEQHWARSGERWDRSLLSIFSWLLLAPGLGLVLLSAILLSVKRSRQSMSSR